MAIAKAEYELSRMNYVSPHYSAYAEAIEDYRTVGTSIKEVYCLSMIIQ